MARLVALVLLLTAPSAWGGAEPEAASAARGVVEDTVEAVLAVLRDPGLPAAERQRRIEEIVYDHFDVDTVARLVLARHRRRFSEEQRSAFVEEFRRHLSLRYGRRIDLYQDETVEFVGERLEPRGDVTVRSRIVGGRADGVQVDYRLRRGAAGWRVIDVVVEGVSLISSYRSQFGEILAQGGPDELVLRLREKNAATEAGGQEAAGSGL